MVTGSSKPGSGRFGSAKKGSMKVALPKADTAKPGAAKSGSAKSGSPRSGAGKAGAVKSAAAKSVSPSAGLKPAGGASITVPGAGSAGTVSAKATSGRGQRDLKVRVKTAKGRKLSSTLWLQRQLNDPYVVRAKKEGYRGRAAYKILELDDKFRFLVPGARVVDLGCAPGGWCQVAVGRVNALAKKSGKRVGTVLGVDIQEVTPLAGAEIYQLDFLADDADEQVKAWLGGKADVVMSDMAASASGNQQVDHLRIIALCEAAAYFAFDVLEVGGTFVAKVLAGGAEQELQSILKKNFTKVANVKPPASRKDSSEKFVVATGFRGVLHRDGEDDDASQPDGDA